MAGGLLKSFGFWSGISFFKCCYYPLLKHAEDFLIAQYPKPAPMSRVSRYLLKRINLASVVERRRKNYQYLLSNSSHFKHCTPLFARLPSDVCPLGFPIVMDTEEQRNTIRNILIRNKIYPPVHWDLPLEVDPLLFPESAHLSSCILTIPIDQRYSPSDLQRVVDILTSVEL